ncbi:hypothetical protein VCH24_56260 [Variovorax boronicumulans]|nr:hypothetical protein VCH24_56260 [Variovorax boronicumulans]
METEITTLLREAQMQDPETSEFYAWSKTAVTNFPITPQPLLDCLEVVRFDYPSSPDHEYRLRSDEIVDDETASLVRSAWHAAGGRKNPESGLNAVRVAGVELVRSQLSSVLWMVSRMKIYREFYPERAEQYLERVHALPWGNSKLFVQEDFVALSIVGVSESAADTLFDWSSHVDGVSGKPAFLKTTPASDSAWPLTQEALLAGVAVLWIDAALAQRDPRQKQRFMSSAASAMWQTGFVSGWDGREEMLRSDAKHAGRRGGAERHRATRELKQWALVQAATQKGSDIAIARRLASQVPERLRDASADPERLIYEALRAAAGDRSSTH